MFPMLNIWNTFALFLYYCLYSWCLLQTRVIKETRSPQSRDTESESELESVGVYSSARSRSHQNLTDSHGLTSCTAPVWLTILRSTLDFVEKNVILLLWTNVFSERSRRRFPRTCFLIPQAIFNAYLQRKALKRTRDRFRQDKNITIMNFNVIIWILKETVHLQKIRFFISFK